MNPVAFEKEFRSFEGDVGKHIHKLTEKVAILSRVSAPGPGKPPRNRTGINYATGELQSRIKTARGRWGFEVEGQVIAVPKYAIFVHEGTAPHIIKPKKPGGQLVFFSAKAGHTIHTTIVHHPGTRAVPFLSENLPLVVK